MVKLILIASMKKLLDYIQMLANANNLNLVNELKLNKGFFNFKNYIPKIIQLLE